MIVLQDDSVHIKVRKIVHVFSVLVTVLQTFIFYDKNHENPYYWATVRPSCRYYRQVFFVHSGLQDESLQVTISKLP